MILVACPTAVTKTPRAIGSKVPVWPIRSSPSKRLNRATTWCEVQPGSFLMTRKPLSTLFFFPCRIFLTGAS